VRYNVIHISLAIALLSNFSLVAQERLSADEILAWFPYGSYESITHYDIESMAKAESFADLQKLFRAQTGERETGILPEILREGIKSITTATLSRLARGKPIETKEGHLTTKRLQEAPETEDKGKKRRQPTSVFYGRIGGKRVAIENVAARLKVFRYDLLDPLIEKAVKDGSMEPTGEMLDNRPVYKLREPEGGGALFLYAAATQELLVADRAKLVGAMAASGLGLEMNVLDNELYADLINLVPDMGQYWMCFFIREKFERMLEEMKKAGAGEEDIAKRQNSLEEGTQYFVRTFLVGKRIVEKEIDVYGSRKRGLRMETDWPGKRHKRRRPRGIQEILQSSEKRDTGGIERQPGRRFDGLR